jgi:hypothetical protein
VSFNLIAPYIHIVRHVSDLIGSDRIQVCTSAHRDPQTLLQCNTTIPMDLGRMSLCRTTQLPRETLARSASSHTASAKDLKDKKDKVVL